MYIKVVQDTLKVTLCKDYTAWAMSAILDGDYKLAGYKLFTRDSEVIDTTIDARESVRGFTEYLTVIGKSKSGYLAMDASGNLYSCGKHIRRLDVTAQLLKQKGGKPNGTKGSA